MKTKGILFTVILASYFFGLTTAFAVNENPVPDNKPEINTEASLEVDSPNSSQSTEQTDVAAGLDEFPNLHPLVVHFPIVLLLLALVLQLIQLFIMNRTLDRVILLTVGIGFIGAYVAGTFVHPHTEGLTDAAKRVLEQHDKFAMLTMWSSGLGTALKLAGLFLLRQKRWFEVLVFIVFAFSGYSVGKAGHYGSQLVYIEGVGPQGNYLGNESEHGHEENSVHEH